MRSPHRSLVVGLVVAAAALSSTGYAHEEVEGSKSDRSTGARVDETAEHPEGQAEEQEEKVALLVDMVLGFGRTPLALQELPQSFATLPPYTAGSARSTSLSFLLGADYHVRPDLAFGLVLPFGYTSFYPPDEQNRATTALGNLELEGEYERRLSQALELAAILGISLPTGQGDELPPAEELQKQNNLSVNQNAFDRYSVNRAAALSRGYEDNALFEVHRFGINPKLRLEFERGRLNLQGYVKVENLIGTSSSLDHSYVGELVPQLRGGYRVHKFAEAALRVWANYVFAGNSDISSTSFAVEPQIVGMFGNLHPTLGVIVPFLGAPTDPAQFVGVRLSLFAAF